MDRLIIFLNNLLFILTGIFFICRIGLFFYINQKKYGKFGMLKYRILPLGVVIPIKKKAEYSQRQNKIIGLANLSLYLFFAGFILAFFVALYGRSRHLL
jgi:hypothetical protein